MEKWEHKLVNPNNQKQMPEDNLDDLGEQGWELVSVVFGLGLMVSSATAIPTTSSVLTYEFQIRTQPAPVHSLTPLRPPLIMLVSA